MLFSLRRRDADFSGTWRLLRLFGAAHARRRSARRGRAQGGVAVDAGGRRSTIATISAGAVAAICKVCAEGREMGIQLGIDANGATCAALAGIG